MAEVDMLGMLESHSDDFARALEAVVKAVAPDVAVDRGQLFEAFLAAIEEGQSRWMYLPDDLVDQG